MVVLLIEIKCKENSQDYQFKYMIVKTQFGIRSENQNGRVYNVSRKWKHKDGLV